MTTTTTNAPVKGLIAKIHVAKKQLAMADESYRALLHRVTGVDTCTRMSPAQLERVLGEFTRLGFKPKASARAGGRKMADTAQAGKIRALWLDLYHLGAVRDPSEEALAAFVKRSCKLPALQWLSPYQADTVIRALRGWLERTGFCAPNAESVKALAARRRHSRIDDEEATDYNALAWKVAMVTRQIEILGVSEFESAPDTISAESLDAVIEAFGSQVRIYKSLQEDNV